MAILSTAKIVGMLASAKKTGKQILNAAGEYVVEVVEDFMSGFAGHGWKIWEYVSGKWKLEIDSIVVRETMTVFELLIQKIRAVKGALGITQANGKIKSAILDDAKQNWFITIEEDEMSFVAHDILRCQNWQNGTLKGYWVEISEIRKIDGVDTIVIPVSEFSGSIDYIDGMEAVVSGLSDMSIPTEGDEIIQFGNTININRQSAIYLHADEGGQPAIDILFGINSKSFAGCVKMRIGGDIPGANGLKGFYCENGLIKGTDSSGHTVYCIYPDGTAEFGDGSARFAADKSGKLAGGAISWEWDADKNKFVCTMGDVILKWDNLDDEVKENLKGEKGDKGDTGEKGSDGLNGADGINGKDGTSIVWKGSYASHPSNPQNGWAYKNTTDGKSYVYQDGIWYQMTVDGVDGVNGIDGTDGLDIVWKGDLSTPPANPVKNWVYRDTDNGRVYIYNGTAWALMVADGNDGADGTNGTDGMSVYITYNDSESQPEKPTGNGTSNGWHTDATSTAVWMSQKVAESVSSGSWGTPIKIKGGKGDTGPQGVPGAPGKDGKVYYTWIKYADDAQGNGISNDPAGKSFIGLAYNKEAETESNTASDYIWSRFRGFDGSDGKDGTDGVPGPAGEDGKTTYTWIAYSDNADGSGMYQVPTDTTKYIGIAVNKDTATESTDPADYTWSRFRGEDGADGQDAVMFAIEFYMNGVQIQNIPCDIHSNPVGGSTLVAKLFRIKGSTKELYSAGNWIVNHRLNGTEVSDLDFSSPRSSVDIAIADVGDFDSISVGVAGGYSPDDSVISASGTIAKVMANVPDWFVGWDTNKVQIGSEYMISPKLFTGKNTGTAEEPILTGIVQGDKCITINGETKSGFYGIKENEIVFSIDSDTADVSTVGDIIANAIKATGLNINNKFKVDKDGIVSSKGSVFDGVYVEGFICSKFSTSFDVDEHEYPKTMNYIVNEGTQLNISLPNDDKYIGAIMTVFLNRNLSSEGMIIGGNVSYNGKRITPLIKNKGTILRLMATYKVNNDLYWEVINFDNRNFALVNLTAVEGSNILFLLDRTTSANPDKSMSGTLKELSDYWDTI